MLTQHYSKTVVDECIANTHTHKRTVTTTTTVKIIWSGRTSKIVLAADDGDDDDGDNERCLYREREMPSSS